MSPEAANRPTGYEEGKLYSSRAPWQRLFLPVDFSDSLIASAQESLPKLIENAASFPKRAAHQNQSRSHAHFIAKFFPKSERFPDSTQFSWK